MEQKPIWFIAAALVFAGMIAWLVSPRGGGGKTIPAAATGGSPVTIAPPPGRIPISVASSSTKKEWLDQAVASFNAASQTDTGLQLNAKPVFVEVILEELEAGKKDHYRSGTMVTDILAGKIKPTIASPAEDSWIFKLNKEWQAANGKPVTTGQASGLVRTPLVIAMWESRARALGCWPTPEPQCTWKRIRALATNPDGWTIFGRPDWGKFKLGYGYVGESNSGTLTAAILCMRGLGKASGLTLGDVSAGNGCGQMIAAVEKAKVHSGKKSSWLLDRMRTGGPEYLDAITTYEQEVVEFNQNPSGLREPMVAVYPQDGTVIVTHPFAILDGAPWVSPDQVKAADTFRKFLLSSQQQSLLLQNGLRPANPQAPLGPPLDAAHGANPAAQLVAIEVPDVLVFDRVREVWHEVKKHAHIAIVFDKSSSMAGNKISQAIQGAQAFVSAMDTKDWLAWLAFDGEIYLGTQGLKSAIGEQLLSDIRSTTAGGGTALYDAVATAFDMVGNKRKALGDSVRYGIVILSDGADTGSRNATLALLEARLRPSERDATGIQIHTIGIGADADDAVLKKIANLAHGKYWKVKNPADVVAVYKEIATHY
jgi:Ca-activated chloride channel family protein